MTQNVEKILAAEKAADDSITEARKKAEKFFEQSELDSAEECAKIISEAKLKAEEIAAKAKSDADAVMNRAKEESKALTAAEFKRVGTALENCDEIIMQTVFG